MDEATMAGFARRNLGVLLLAALLGVAVAVTLLVSTTNERNLVAQESRIVQLEGELSKAVAANAEQNDVNAQSALGVTASRVERDTARITELLQTAFNWDSGEAYDGARESLKRRWGFTEQTPFLADFMPMADFNQASDGKRFYYIDAAGLESSLAGRVQVNVASVQGTVYSYAAIASTEVSAPVDGANGEQGLRITTQRRMLLNISIDGDGKVTVIVGIPASGHQRTA